MALVAKFLLAQGMSMPIFSQFGQKKILAKIWPKSLAHFWPILG